MPFASVAEWRLWMLHDRPPVSSPDALARGLARLPETTGPARALLVALLGRLALDLAPRQPSAVSALLPLIADADPRAARQAVMAAGKLPAEFAPTVEP